MAAHALTPLCDALAELELASALVLLAEQEATPVAGTLPRLRSALATVHAARELAAELASACGQPTLHVLNGRVSLPEAQAQRNGSDPERRRMFSPVA
jgi:hypothetical protein